MRHYIEAYTAPLGFNPHPVLTLSAQLPEGSYPTWQARVSYYDQMLEKVSSIPGVAAATFSSSYPENAQWTTDVTVQGGTANSGRESELQLISPGYFSALGIPQVSGRIFTRAETLRGAPLTIVDSRPLHASLPPTRSVHRGPLLHPRPLPGAPHLAR